MVRPRQHDDQGPAPNQAWPPPGHACPPPQTWWQSQANHPSVRFARSRAGMAWFVLGALWCLALNVVYHGLGADNNLVGLASIIPLVALIVYEWSLDWGSAANRVPGS